MDHAARIALFPLRTVLFPQGLLPLRVFETRYLDMIGRVMREGEGFGVVLIRSGAEVGEVGEMADVGTYARVADFGSLPGGLLSIVARGERRFRILRRGLQPDGLHVAEVQWLEEPEEQLESGEHAELITMLGQALERLAGDYPVGASRLQDAAWVAGHLGQLWPGPAGIRQQILEIDGARNRLQAIQKLIQDGVG